MSGWGPSHSCELCGAAVQYHRPDDGFSRLFDAGTLARHRCQALSAPVARDMLECLCGVDVTSIDGVRFDLRGIHACACTPAPSVRPAVVAPPKRITVAQVVRESPAANLRGVIRIP